MNTIDWQQEAIANNMAWYAAQCQSHQIAYELTDAYWMSQRPMMPYYSNLVWAGKDNPTQMIERQMAAGADPGTKDAYARFDLTGVGLERLFDARWIALEPHNQIAAASNLAARFISPDELPAWISAWGETPPGRPVFVPGIMVDPSVFFLCVEVDGDMVGGAIANLSGQAVGISNTFGSPDAVGACLEVLRRHFPDRGIVGYERGEDLDNMRRCGARVLGELTVWIKP